MEIDIKSKKNYFLIVAMWILNLTIFTDLLPFNTLLKIVSIILLIIAVLYKRSTKITINKFVFLMILFTLFVASNSIVGGDLSYIITFCTNIIIMILLIQFPEFAKKEIKIIFVICSVQLFFSILVEIAPTSFINNLFSKIILYDYNANYSWRVLSGINVGITKQPGISAMYMVTLSAYFFAKIIKENKKFKYVVGYILCISIIFLTTKRAAIIFTFLTVIILLILYGSKKASYKTISKWVFFIIIGVSLFYFFNTRFDLLTNLKNKNTELVINNDLSNGRINLWKNSMSLFLEKPILGIGLKNYYYTSGLDIHNTYIQYLVEMGIVGFLAFIVCIGGVIGKCILICKNTYTNGLKGMEISTIIGLYLLIFLVLYGFVGNTFIDYLPLSMFIISICMIINDYYLKGVDK